MKSQRNFQRGFTLFETVLTLVVISIVAAIGFSKMYNRDQDVGGAEKILQTVSAKIAERRSDALRLRGEERRLPVTFKAEAVDPLPINFADLQTTASMVFEGVDENKDYVEDVTGQPLTYLVGRRRGAYWIFQYADNPIILPANWQVAQSPNDLGSIPLIAGGTAGRGYLITGVYFAPDGSAVKVAAPYFTGDLKIPPGTPAVSSTPSSANAPFWAIYFVSSDKQSAVAVAVYLSGTTENFRWSGSQWIGNRNRTFN